MLGLFCLSDGPRRGPWIPSAFRVFYWNYGQGKPRGGGVGRGGVGPGWMVPPGAGGADVVFPPPCFAGSRREEDESRLQHRG